MVAISVTFAVAIRPAIGIPLAVAIAVVAAIAVAIAITGAVLIGIETVRIVVRASFPIVGITVVAVNAPAVTIYCVISSFK